MKFSPGENYFLVAKEIPVVETGLIKVTARETLMVASVIAAGPQRRDNTAVYQSTDLVVFQQHLALPVKCDNTSAEEHFIIHKEHILGKMLP